MTSDSDATEMPVFPLGTVLLPGQLLPLNVFEPRYRVLLFDLRDVAQPEFVVTLIERGSEVGGGDVRSSMGCVARIQRREDLDDGRTLLVVVGTRRVEINEWLAEDPYPRAVVRERGEPTWPTEGPPEGSLVARTIEAARTVGDLASRLGGPGWPEDLDLATDPVACGWQLALLAPLATLDRQRLLVVDDPVERWSLLHELLVEQRELLSARIEWAGGADGGDRPGDEPAGPSSGH